MITKNWHDKKYFSRQYSNILSVPRIIMIDKMANYMFNKRYDLFRIPVCWGVVTRLFAQQSVLRAASWPLHFPRSVSSSASKSSVN
jgi:hypothetical protein